MTNAISRITWPRSSFVGFDRIWNELDTALTTSVDNTNVFPRHNIVKTDEDTGQTIIAGMGELHLEVGLQLVQPLLLLWRTIVDSVRGHSVDHTVGSLGRSILLLAIPMGRYASAEDVGWAVRFLAAPEAGYITGQTLIVATEPHIIHQMQLAIPDKQFIGAPGADGNCNCNICPYMALNTMEKLYVALRDLSPQQWKSGIAAWLVSFNWALAAVLFLAVLPGAFARLDPGGESYYEKADEAAAAGEEGAKAGPSAAARPAWSW